MTTMFVCGLGYGQVEKGRVFLGGNVGFSRNSNSPAVSISHQNSQAQLSINPQIGYFVSDKWALEFGLNYQGNWIRTSNPNVSLDEQRFYRNAFGLDAGARYYVPTSHEKFVFFLSKGIGYRFGDAGYDFNQKVRGVNAYIAPNFNYFFTKKWVLQLSFTGIAFNSSRLKSSNSTVTERQNFFTFGASSFTPSLGVLYFLR